MLASAGRRYLMILVSSAHSLPAAQPQAAGLLEVLQPLMHRQSNQLFSSSAGHMHSDTTEQQQPLQQQQQQQEFSPSAAGAQQQDAVTPPAAQPLQQQQQQQQQPVQRPFAAMGPRKVDPSLFGSSKAPRVKQEGIVHINSTMNNTHLVLTDRASKVETWVSGGTVGYKNANKASPMAAELAAKELARRALDKGFHSVVVKLKGMGKNKQFAVQSLAASGLTVTQIWDVTPIAYNGCRLPRRRRV